LKGENYGEQPHCSTFSAWQYRFWQRRQSQPLSLHYWLTHPQRLPRFVRESAVTQRYMTLLSPLNWAAFPERNLEVDWGTPTVPYTAFTGMIHYVTCYAFCCRSFIAPILRWQSWAQVY
jgi:hypothetical protein